MKADILRRVQEASDDEDDDVAKGAEYAFEDELEEVLQNRPSVRLAGVDGEDTEEDAESDAEGTVVPVKVGILFASPLELLLTLSDFEQSKPPTEQNQDVENILAQAYIRDAKVFERDANTRRSKARAELRTQTGWSPSLCLAGLQMITQAHRLGRRAD